MNSIAEHDLGHTSLAAFVRERIRRDCVFRAPEHAIVSPSGKGQDWLIDLRRLFVQPDALSALAELVLNVYRDPRLHIAGLETAAIPLVTAVALVGFQHRRSVSCAIIRKERKTTGLGRAVEGLCGGGEVILFDDILNSGDSAEKARVALLREGVRVRRMFVVIDYRSRSGLAWRREHGIEVRALFRPADFGLVAQRRRPWRPRRSYRQVWTFRAPGAQPYHVVPKSAPLLVGERLYFGTDTGAFLALDANTGRPVWEHQARGTQRKGIWSSPAHHDGLICYGAYNGDVYGLDAASGREVWCQPSCEWVGSSPLILAERGLVVIGLEYERPRAQGSMCALSLASGAKVWESWLKIYQHGSAVHWRRGDLVICGTNDHSVVALEPASGATRWSFATRRSVKYAPAVDEARGLVAFASFDRSIYILDAETGRKVAEFPTNNICYTTPLFKDGRLFCGSGDRHFYVVDLDTMTLALKFNAGARVYSSPRAIGNSVIFGTNGGIVREFDARSLEIVGQFTVADAVTNAVAATADGARIFVPTYMNEIYALDRAQLD